MGDCVVVAAELEPKRGVLNLGKAAVAGPLGLEIDEAAEFDDWARIGIRLSKLGSAAAWWIGDWLAFGERKYERGRYQAGMEELGLSYGTLRDYAWVAGCFALSRRRDNLSFGHHREVAPLKEADQDEWLDRAEAEGWSQKELRAAVAASRGRVAIASGTKPFALALSQPERELLARAVSALIEREGASAEAQRVLELLEAA